MSVFVWACSPLVFASVEPQPYVTSRCACVPPVSFAVCLKLRIANVLPTLQAKMVFLYVTLSVLQASQCYVLLTANVEDVHAIANQVVHSPVVKEIKDAWRRASDTFRKHYESPEDRSMQMRAGSGMGRDDSSHESSRELKAEQRKAKEELAAIGRNASEYVNTIQDVIESL